MENLPTKPSHDVAKEMWLHMIVDNGDDIDPENEHEWETLAFGFFLALGFPPDEARELSADVDY